MKTIQLNNRPVGVPQLSDFKLVTEAQPQIADGEMLLKAAYLSVDPYLRGRMMEGKSYIEPFELLYVGLNAESDTGRSCEDVIPVTSILKSENTFMLSESLFTLVS